MTEHQTETQAEDVNLIDVTIYLEGGNPLPFSCEAAHPMLLTLFRGLRKRVTHPDDVIFLSLGEGGTEKIYFKQSQLVSIETRPALGESFFASLEQPDNVESFETTTISETPEGPFPDDWKIWIWHNVSRGCSKDTIFKELIEHGFSREAVAAELGHEPSVPLEQIEIPRSHGERPEYSPSPLAKRLDVEALEIYEVDDFLNEAECHQLMEEVLSATHPSTTVAEEDRHAGRTSQTHYFEEQNDPSVLISQVNSRLSKLIGIGQSYGEPLQGHVYHPGDEYCAHYDWFPPGTEEFKVQASQELGGQRTWSVVLYLNDVTSGGHTDFPDIGLSVKPKRGKLVFWNNIAADGMPSDNALHQASPVESGVKVVLTTWYRTFGAGPMYFRDPEEYIPCYTDKGFEKREIPASLFLLLKDHYQRAVSQMWDEFVPGGYLQNQDGLTPSSMLDMDQELKDTTFQTLKPILENWADVPLRPTSVYGIRCYHRGTSLRLHRDIDTTHIVSAILNIEQDTDHDWPLVIEDHLFRRHAVLLAPGEMLLYESARLLHGRPSPLEGESYANVFVHYCPADYSPPEQLLSG